MTPIQIEAAGSTDKGQVRANNEDAYFIAPTRDLFLVADGMGGHAGGEIASATIVEVVTDDDDRSTWQNPVQDLPSLLLKADAAVRDKAVDALTNMGSTVVALYFAHEQYWVAHAGDSRAYRFRDDALQRLTNDHTPDFALNGVTGAACRRTGMITRAVGVGAATEFDVSVGQAESQDRYLLCSDGLTDAVDEIRIADILRQNLPPDAAVARLISAANAAGGPDNITAVVVALL